MKYLPNSTKSLSCQRGDKWENHILEYFAWSSKENSNTERKRFSGITTQLFWGLLQIYLYMAFLNTESVDGFSITQMASYIWLGQAFFAMRYILMGKKHRSKHNKWQCLLQICPSAQPIQSMV